MESHSLEQEQFKRLRLVLGLIDLGDLELVGDQVPRLEKAAAGNEQLLSIVEALRGGRYGEAASGIRDRLDAATAVQPYVDPEVGGLRLEINNLNVEIVELESSKAEIESRMRIFNARFDAELGDLMEAVLKAELEAARRRKEQGDEGDGDAGETDPEADYKRWADEYEQYSRQRVEAARDSVPPPELSEDEQAELKRYWKSVAAMTHPDAVARSSRNYVATLFITAKEAYERRDVDTLRDMYESLTGGKIPAFRSDGMTELSALRAEAVRLRSVIAGLEQEIAALESSDTWKTVTGIGDWDEYFAGNRTDLEARLSELTATAASDSP